MYAVLKALSLLDGAKKYHKDSTPKLTDTILSIKASDVNAYFGKSDEFCISAKKKPHPPDGDAGCASQVLQMPPQNTVFCPQRIEKSSTFLWSFSVSKKSPTCHCEERSDVAI